MCGEANLVFGRWLVASDQWPVEEIELVRELSVSRDFEVEVLRASSSDALRMTT